MKKITLLKHIFNFKNLTITPIFAILSLIITITTNAREITLNQITADVSFLASDKLDGRANFSPGIEKAADYISSRFSAIGLKPIKGETSFKQQFTVTTIKPKSLSVTLNNKLLAQNQLAIATTMESLLWQSADQFSFHLIGADDDFRQTVRSINAKGGKHLLLVNTKHSDMFSRYQGFFKRGLTKLSVNDQGAIVLLLTDETAINSIDLKATSTSSSKLLTNVVGVLPGHSKPDEMVLYSAHYDHLGSNAKVNDGSDSIYNGADDDASGTTAVINLAQHFARQATNARTIVFIAFAAEEIGGFGSQYFSNQLDPDHVIAMINIEMIGKPSKFGKGTLWITGPERSNLLGLLNAKLNLEADKMEIHQDPYPKQNLFYRSDNATLARLGVPAHSFSTTQLDKDKFYHQVSDEVATLDLKSMYQTINILAIATEGLVTGKDTPTRIDTSKVKSLGKIY